MRLLSILLLTTVLFFHCSISNAQDITLFSPFDCREHAELQQTEVSDTLDAASAIVEPLLFHTPELFIEVDTLDRWKEWAYVENYAFGKDRGSLTMITDLEALHPFFRDRILDLINTCNKKGIELAIVETYRTHAKQHEYKTMGKRYTSSGAGKSKHQYGLAIDVVPMVNGVAVWDNAALWRKIGVAGERLGLRWGGRWKKPYDPGHFEWTGGLSTSHLHHGTYPPVPKSDERYPCLEEDLRILRRYWNEWETTQSSFTRK